MASANPNLEFTRLSQAVSLYTPPTEADSSAPKTDPTTIIICQWMGASPKSRGLNFIFSQHHDLFPNARIVSVRSLPAFFITTSTAARLAAIKPAVSAIEADPAEEPRILVHLFSNGGSLGFVDVCNLYKEATGKILPVDAVVLDSSPGQPTLKEGWTAMSLTLPKGLMWYPGAALIMVGLGISAVAKNVFGMETIVERCEVTRRVKGMFVWSYLRVS